MRHPGKAPFDFPLNLRWGATSYSDGTGERQSNSATLVYRELRNCRTLLNHGTGKGASRRPTSRRSKGRGATEEHRRRGFPDRNLEYVARSNDCLGGRRIPKCLRKWRRLVGCSDTPCDRVRDVYDLDRSSGDQHSVGLAD